MIFSPYGFAYLLHHIHDNLCGVRFPSRSVARQLTQQETELRVPATEVENFQMGLRVPSQTRSRAHRRATDWCRRADA